jgi:hypothetical protein
MRDSLQRPSSEVSDHLSPQPIAPRRPWRSPYVILATQSSDTAKTLFRNPSSPHSDIHVTQTGLNTDIGGPQS